MTRIDERARLCADCNTVVRDLSAMGEEEAKRLLASQSGRVCLRYLFDPATGEIAFTGQAPLIPADRLGSSLRKKIARGLAVAAPVLLQACGGGLGAYEEPSRQDPFEAATPTVAPERTDAGDARAPKAPADAALDALDVATDAGAD